MDWYKLDENGCPRLVTIAQFESWRLSLPEHIQTGVGFQLAQAGDSSGRIVSTVYLGMDHSHDDGLPVLWETMLFSDGAVVKETEEAILGRYRSREEAQKGHDFFVEELLKGSVHHVQLFRKD